MKIAIRMVVLTLMLAAGAMSFASTSSLSGPGPVPTDPNNPPIQANR
jgi:hypothetical protein